MTLSKTSFAQVLLIFKSIHSLRYIDARFNKCVLIFYRLSHKLLIFFFSPDTQSGFDARGIYTRGCSIPTGALLETSEKLMKNDFLLLLKKEGFVLEKLLFLNIFDIARNKYITFQEMDIYSRSGAVNFP
jgi:hypothetical protein